MREQGPFDSSPLCLSRLALHLSRLTERLARLLRRVDKCGQGEGEFCDSVVDEEAAPPRPDLPLLLVVGLAFWFGAASATWCLQLDPPKLIVVFVAGLLAVLLFVLYLRYEQAILVSLAFMVLGLSVQMTWSIALDEERDALRDVTRVLDAPVMVLSDSAEGTFGSYALGEASIDGSQYRMSLNLKTDEPLGFGEAILVTGSVSAPSEAGGYLDRKGAAGSINVEHWQRASSNTLLNFIGTVRLDLLQKLERTWPNADTESGDKEDDSSLALVKAVSFGARDGLYDSVLYEDVRTVGLAHLVAVSGAHLSLVVGMLQTLMTAMRTPTNARIFLTIVSLLAYLLLVGMPVSCLRALVMVSLGLLGSMGRRRANARSAIGLVSIFFVASDPSCAMSLSFALSLLATLGIILFMRHALWWLARIDWLPHSLAEVFAMTLCALSPTLPITMSTFGQLPLIAPIANVIAVPFLTVLVAAGLVLLPASLIPFAFELAVSFLAITADLFTSCASLLASIPGASIPVDLELAPVGFVTALVCFLWWWAWPRPTLRNATLIGCLVLLLAFGVVGLRTSAAGDNLVMLDVGQGDAFLYESEGMSLLVDTGNQEAKLLSALASEGVSHLDGVVLSHADDDHVGCLGSLRGYIAVDTVFVANGYAESDEEKVLSVMREAERLTGSDPVELKMGSRFTVGRFAFEVLAPERLRNDSDNQDSLCLLATLDPGEPGGKTWRILTAGDAESETLDPLARTGAIDDIDVLKVSHHGSRLSVDEELLERSQPEVALISVGEGNRYGHPTDTALDLLEGVGARIYRSDLQGSVRCKFAEDGIHVSALG